MFTLRKTLKRLKSLEEYLGVYYVGEYDQHNNDKYSEVERLKERLDKLEGKKK